MTLGDHRYHSRFTNRHGDEWEFEYDSLKKEGVLRGSDVDWRDYRVLDARVAGLMLNEEEIRWLQKAWAEATEME